MNTCTKFFTLKVFSLEYTWCGKSRLTVVSRQNTDFILIFLLIITLFSIWIIVNLLLPHSVYTQYTYLRPVSYLEMSILSENINNINNYSEQMFKNSQKGHHMCSPYETCPVFFVYNPSSLWLKADMKKCMNR